MRKLSCPWNLTPKGISDRRSSDSPVKVSTHSQRNSTTSVVTGPDTTHRPHRCSAVRARLPPQLPRDQPGSEAPKGPSRRLMPAKGTLGLSVPSGHRSGVEKARRTHRAPALTSGPSAPPRSALPSPRQLANGFEIQTQKTKPSPTSGPEEVLNRYIHDSVDLSQILLKSTHRHSWKTITYHRLRTRTANSVLRTPIHGHAESSVVLLLNKKDLGNCMQPNEEKLSLAWHFKWSEFQ